MNFEKYSKQRFELLGLDTPDARKLADDLQGDVNEEIHPAVRDALLNVIDQLKVQGHKVSVIDDRPGDISFHDGNQCRLRLGCNVVISAGYGHESIPLSGKVKDSISKKLETTWERYIDAIHRFISINISLIIGLAGIVSLVPTLRGQGAPLGSKNSLFWGFVLLVMSLVFQVSLRIWGQMFMEYEILQPQADVRKYFGLSPHYTSSYRFGPRTYRWLSRIMRVVTLLAAVSFLFGLSLSLRFLYQNLQ